MKKILGIVLSIVLAFSMILMLTGCGEKQTNDVNKESKVIANEEGVINIDENMQYEKIIKAELVKIDGQPYEEYDLYIYYYFKNDILISEEKIYIFDSVAHAEQWYNAHIELLQDRSLSRIEGNKVVDKEINSQYINWGYNDILKMVKENITTTSYTEE